MSNGEDPTASSNDSESIYRAPTSDTSFEPKGDLLAAYLGPKNADYYLRHFEQFKSGGVSASWNWPAFLITSVWVLYRKMWLNAFLYLLVLPVALGVVAALLGLASGAAASNTFYYGGYLLIAFVLVPVFANRLYYSHAQNKINKVAAVTSSAEQQSLQAARIGGTSNVVLVVVPFFMIVVVGILAAIAIPAYNDYTVRAQVSEGLNLSAGAKAAVTEYFQDSGEFPIDNKAAGLTAANRISGNYVVSVAVSGGEVVVTYGNKAHVTIAGETLVLTPERRSDDKVNWSCMSPSIAAKNLPAACR